MTETAATPLEQIIAIRKEKLEKMRQAGINPYPAVYPAQYLIKDMLSRFEALKTGETLTETVSVSGRLVSRREMGKASFADISDFTGKVQL
ncbi:MAG: lysine--tRNA ligase, partial [Endomicrobiales bacterium]